MGSRPPEITKGPDEFSGSFDLEGQTYSVQTEAHPRTRKVVTRIYEKGQIVFSKETEFPDVPGTLGEQALEDLMKSQHKSAADEFFRQRARAPEARAGAPEGRASKTRAEYLEEYKTLLRRGAGSSAISILEEGLKDFPSDPFLLSYYGNLLAVVNKNFKEGIKFCRQSLKKFKDAKLLGGEFFYSIFYLNLGKAYLAADNKAEAIKALNEGLQSDPGNSELLWELKKLGIRRKPPVPFLKRANKVNKVLGQFLSKPAPRDKNR